MRGYAFATLAEPLKYMSMRSKSRSMIQNAFNISIFFLLFLIPIIDVVTNTPK